MRKLKPKTDKLKSKHIINALNDNKEYYLLLRCLCELPSMIQVVFGLSRNDLRKYITEKVKINYNSELIKDCWYRGLNECLNRWLKLCDRIRVDKEDIAFVQTKPVTDFFVQNIGSIICDFQLLLNEKIKEDKLRDVIMLISVIKAIILCTRDRNKLLKHFEKKDVKYIRWLLTTYQNVFAGMLYDMQNYEGYVYKMEVLKSC